MKISKAIVATFATMALCMSLCACSGTSATSSSSASGSSEASSAASSTASSAASSDAASGSASSSSATVEGTPLFDFIAKGDPEASWLGDGFTAANVLSISFYRDNFETITTEDPDYIEKMCKGLEEIVVTGPKSDDKNYTDAVQSVTLNMDTGDSYTVTFDFTYLVLGGEYYDTANRTEFTSACMYLELDYNTKQSQ